MAEPSAIVPLPVRASTLERLSPAEVRANADAARELLRAALDHRVDYGQIPSTKGISLLKPGAEKLLLWARLGHRLEEVRVERDDDGNRVGGLYRCVVFTLADPDVVVATADGYAGYEESRFHGERYDKETKQKVPWRADWNNVIQMAQKRALVAATKAATATSGLFDEVAEPAEAPPAPPWWQQLGWESAEACDAAHKPFLAWLRNAPAGARQAAKEVAEGHGFAKWPVAKEVFLRAKAAAEEADREAQAPSAPAPSARRCVACGLEIDEMLDGGVIWVGSDAYHPDCDPEDPTSPGGAG